MPYDCTQHSAVHVADSSALQHTLYWIVLLLLWQEMLCGCLAAIFALHCGPSAHADHALVRYIFSMHLFLCTNLTDLSALCFSLMFTGMFAGNLAGAFGCFFQKAGLVLPPDNHTHQCFHVHRMPSNLFEHTSGLS